MTSELSINNRKKRKNESRIEYLLRLTRDAFEEPDTNAMELPSTSFVAPQDLINPTIGELTADQTIDFVSNLNSERRDLPESTRSNNSQRNNGKELPSTYSIDSFNEDSDDSVADKNYEPSNPSSTSEENDVLNDDPKEQIKKKLTRKRVRNFENWEKNLRKRKRNLGEEYVSAAKKNIKKKEMKGPCGVKCRLRCSTKFTENQRRLIFEAYWKLGCLERQRSFIDSHTSEISPTYRSCKVGSNRSKNLKYKLHVEEKAIQVCKTFFKNTLDINNRTIFTTTKKIDPQGFLISDQRGKHGNQKKIKPEIKESVRMHINSFPRVSSHYCRSRTKKEYLEGNLNIATMYRLYVDNCKANNEELVKLSMYSNILNTETNIAFHAPKKDQCSLCTNYENGNEVDKNILKGKYETHLKEKVLSRKEKNDDIQTNENTQVCCFDLQAVLTTPCGEVNSFYYKRRLSTYNLTVFDIKQRKAFCFLWHEGIAKRGANEVGSCIYNFLISDDCKGKHIIFYSDNCTGQNKNKYLYILYLFSVVKLDKIKSITHKFLEKGHTQNEGDSVHATIEREKNRILKSGPIFVPAQWATIIKGAKKSGAPYKVNEISTQDIYDIKSLCTDMGNNYTKNTENEKIPWNEFRIVQVKKTHPDIIFYKTSYTQDNFKSVNIKQNLKQLRNQSQKEIRLLPAYKSAPPIDSKKKKDLLNLCKENAIKPVYWPFYKNLPEKSENISDTPLSESSDFD